VLKNEAAADSGVLYTFTHSGTTWTQQAYLTLAKGVPFAARSR
jgi:hypothetical protein